MDIRPTSPPRRLGWEDGALAGATLAWMAAPKGMAVFHLYTVVVMVLILSLGFHRGLWAGLSRAALACAAIFLFAVAGPMRHPMGMEILSLAACGTFAGVLGQRQRRAQEELKRSFYETLEALARALEARDPYTEGHSRRTARYASAIARVLGLKEPARSALEQAGLLHDLGKIGTPDAVLRKEGPLTPAEGEEMRRHPAVGGRILQGVGFLAEAAALVRHHHEHFDGSGYPDGMAGPAIPLGARILAVADALDAMTSDRPYRKAMPLADALRELEHRRGSDFDPAVIEALKRTQLQTNDAGARL